MYTQLIGAALVAAEREVEQRAQCAQAADPDAWFPPVGLVIGSPAQQAARQLEARALCASCPVRDLCAQAAISRGEQHGVWGGLSEWEVQREVRAHRLIWDRPDRRAA